MSRFDITIGLLAAILTIFVLALYGTRESSRMEAAAAGFDNRAIENGAAMFNQYCETCHGFNASGSMCPPLDETSGLHGGDLGAGVACRLEEVGWNKDDPFGYVVSVISSGRSYSTRPDMYPGNRAVPTVPAGTATALPLQAMPAWSQEFGGPLRPDQVRDIAAFIVAFRESLPDDAEEVKALACDPARIKAATEAPASVRRPTSTAVGGEAGGEAGAEGTGTPGGTDGTPASGTATARTATPTP